MPYVSLDPQTAYDFKVEISGIPDAIYANKVTGGETAFEKTERYVGGYEFKQWARGRKSVGEVTIEHGVYPLKTGDTEEGASAGSKSYAALRDLADLETSGSDRMTVTVTTLRSDKSPDQKVVYGNCQITSVATGDFDAQGESVLVYSLTFQPSSKDHDEA